MYQSHTYQTTQAVWVFHWVVPSLVLKTVGVMRQVRRAFRAFNDPDQDLAPVMELRVFPKCDQFLVSWSYDIWALAHLARHSKILIRLSCTGTESLRRLGFLSDHAKLSALWSRASWPYYSYIWSYEIWGFECQSSHASLQVCFWRTEGGDRGGRGGEREPNQILLEELAYVSSSNPRAKTL
jgi:hypothetical protein